MAQKRFIQAMCCFLTALAMLLLSAVILTFMIIFVNCCGFEKYATMVDIAVTVALVLILPLLATLVTSVCIELVIGYKDTHLPGTHTSAVELGLDPTPRPTTASNSTAVELESSQSVTPSGNNLEASGHSTVTRESQFDAISNFNSITITSNHLQVPSETTRSICASVTPERMFEKVFPKAETQEGSIPTVEDYVNNQHLLITSHLLRFKRQLCQRMSIAVTIMTAIGYASIGLSLTIVNWTVITAANHLDKTEFVFLLSRKLLALLCPTLGLTGCTILGITLMYVSSGQIDGKLFMSTLLPAVQLARRISKSNKVPKQRGKCYWMLSSTACIAINPPRGSSDQLRHYLDNTPATWVLMVVIYISVMGAANFMVTFGVTIQKEFRPTAKDCSTYTWHCYLPSDSFLGSSVDCNVYVLGNESLKLPPDSDLTCYRFTSLKEIETVAGNIAGSAAVYLVSAYMIPYLMRGMLMLERVKKTKLWALIPTILGGIGSVVVVGMILVYPTSSLLLHTIVFTLCLLAIGVLSACSRTQLMLTPPEIQHSVIVDMDSKLVNKIAMRLEEQATAAAEC